jgi:hypothetical protein
MLLLFFKTRSLRTTGDITDVPEFTTVNYCFTDTYLSSLILKIPVLILLLTLFS